MSIDEQPSEIRELTLAGDFPAASHEQWMRLVDKVLARGLDDPTPEELRKRFEHTLVSRTYDGIEIQPLYEAPEHPVDSAGFPGVAPYIRGRSALGTGAGWDICQRAGQGTALEELQGGSTSVWVALGDDAGKLASALHGVVLDAVTIRIEAGPHTAEAAKALVELWKKAKVNPSEAKASLGFDPIGDATKTGRYEAEVEKEVSSAAALAAGLAGDGYKSVRSFVADGVNYHNAGASEAQELAASLATALPYLKALVDAGLSVPAAFGQIEARYAASADQFNTIAKLRAARRLWARVGEVLAGAQDASTASPARAHTSTPAPPPIHAVTSPAMLTAYDPWVNLLRSTVACFAAGVGGADAVTVLPHDEVATGGSPGEKGRRLARNIQHILIDESHVAQVIDLAGGSGYVETLTDAMAEAAWKEFQQIETEGGILASLQKGALQKRIDSTWEARRARLAKTADPLTGVSEFPNVDEPAPAVLPTRGSEPAKGALPVHRYAEDFETLRASVDSHVASGGKRPEIYLASLGNLAAFTTRATFAQNLFGVAGLKSVTGEAPGTPESVAKGFKASGARVACICSSDEVYAKSAAAAAKALKAAGAKRVYLAGKPGKLKDELESAGVNEFVFAGCDRLAVLTTALKTAEVGK